MKKEYNLKVLDSNGKVKAKSHIFQLEDPATVSALKKAYEEKIRVFVAEEIRLFFRNENGQDLPLEDDDILDVVGVQAGGGQILVECPSLGPGSLDVKITIHKNFDEPIYVLTGDTKDFEHYKIVRYDENNLNLDKGNYLSYYHCGNVF